MSLPNPRPLLLLLLTALVLTGVLAIAWDRQPPIQGREDAVEQTLPSTEQVLQQTGPVVEGTARAVGGFDPGRRPSGRPAQSVTHPEENRHVVPPGVVEEAYVSGVILDAQVYIGDVALPWRYHVSNALAGRPGEEAIHRGVEDWNGQPGSRWAAAFGGYTDVDEPVADGTSTIFLETGCEGLTNANAYLFTDGGLGINRFGADGTQILEADIGLCARADDEETIRRAIRHEVGHVVGLAHQCNAGEDCWREGMGTSDLSCRTMFWQARTCQDGLGDGDRLALRRLYPTIRPLRGPTPAETAAWASFAMFDDGTAPAAVVLAPDVPAGVAPSAAALAARLGGTFLLGGEPGPTCLSGPARAEANRALGRRATLVLVGDWPASCQELAYDWELGLRTVDAGPDDDVAALAVAMAELARLGGPSRSAVLTAMSADGTTIGGDAVAAATAAGLADAPLLALPPGPIPPVLSALLAEDRIDGLTVLGNVPGLVDRVREVLGAAVRLQRIAGADRVGTALLAAERAGGTQDEVVLVPGNDPLAGLSGAVLATHRGAALLVSPPVVHPAVVSWLARVRPSAGWVVGGTGPVQGTPATGPSPLPSDVVTTYALQVG